jgi:hypothetical protein
VSWRFDAPATDGSVAVLVPRATRRAFEVVAYNLEKVPVHATMTAWGIDPGRWRLERGVDTDGDDRPDRAGGPITHASLELERGSSLPLVLPPRAATVLRFELEAPGVPYAARPDLGIAREDVIVDGASLEVSVHSLGAVAAPASRVVFRDAAGRAIAYATVPPLPAPLDLRPKKAIVVVALPRGTNPAGGTVNIELDPRHPVQEITRLNNSVKL